MSTLLLKISSRTVNEQEVWEGTVNLCGVRPTKLVRKSDGSTTFGARSAVLVAARQVAKRFGYEGVETAENSSRSKKQAATATT